MKLNKIISIFVIVLFLSVLSGCFSDGSSSSGGSGSGGGDIEGDSFANVRITSISANPDSFSLQWDDPGNSGLSVIYVACSNGLSINVSPGTESVTFDSLTANTDYKVTFKCSYSSGDISVENVIFITTAPAGATAPVEHTAISIVNEFVTAVNAAGGLDGDYFLTNDLDLSAYQTGTGWVPIGTDANRFTGTFNGNGYSITGLKINNAPDQLVGFFGFIYNSKISNLKIENAEVKAANSTVGGIAGSVFNSSVINCSFSGDITGGNGVGGLIGNALNSIVSNCYSKGTVTGNINVGGFIGSFNSSNYLSNSYSTCVVNANTNAGGFIGNSYYATLTNCYAAGSSNGDTRAGGFVGIVTSGEIRKCYSIATVNGSSDRGGFAGQQNAGTISNCYWNTDIYSANNGLGSGLTTLQMQDASNVSTNYNTWDFTNVWSIVDGEYPTLRNMPE